MGLRILHPGLSTTIQDEGRPGFREWGVPVGGAFDRGAAALANALLGNLPEAALLEMTLLGGTYEALTDLGLALAGAPLETNLRDPNGRRHPIRLPASLSMRAGEQLHIGGSADGARTYLAVKGGWLTAPTLGSRSSERRLRAGEVLPAAPGRTLSRQLSWPQPSGGVIPPLRIIAGPDAEAIDLSALEHSAFGSGPACDRMGLRLESSPIDVTSPPDRLSMPLAPGALQVAGRQIIILGVAGGTMGGYPHVAQVISADLDRLAQLRPGSPIRFEVVSVAAARELDRLNRPEHSKLLNAIRELVRQSDRAVLGD